MEIFVFEAHFFKSLTPMKMKSYISIELIFNLQTAQNCGHPVDRLVLVISVGLGVVCCDIVQ